MRLRGSSFAALVSIRILAIFLFSGGCGKPPDTSCNNFVPYLNLSQPPGSANIGNVTFTVNYRVCDDYAGQQMWLTVVPPVGQNQYQHRTIDNIPYQGTLTFTHYFSQAGVYQVWVAAGAAGSEPLGRMQSVRYGIQILSATVNEFRVIQLQMVNDELWPNNIANNYIGAIKRDNAFRDASTNIHAIKNLQNISNSANPDSSAIDLSTSIKILQWAIWVGYGEPNPPNLDNRVGILCGIDDVPTNIVRNPEGGIAAGVTLSTSDHSTPPVSCVLYSRVRNFFQGEYDRARVLTGSAIHELGHAIGVFGDDPNITHSGNNSSNCAMRSGLGPTAFTNPVFCDYHIQLISSQTWYR